MQELTEDDLDQLVMAISWKRFGKHICQHFLSRAIDNLYVSLGNLLPAEVVADVDVLAPLGGHHVGTE